MAGRYHDSQLQKYFEDQEDQLHEQEEEAELDRLLLEISDSECEEEC